MDWISVKNQKPDRMICAMVCNDKGWMGAEKAIYYPDYDAWRLDNPQLSILLDVTHWFEIPPLPPQQH